MEELFARIPVFFCFGFLNADFMVDNAMNLLEAP